MILVILFVLFFVAVFLLTPNEAQASGTMDVNLTGDPCTASDGGCTPGANAEIGVDTVTYTHVISATDNMDSQYQFRYGVSAGAGDQAVTVVTDDVNCAGGSAPVVLTTPTFDISGITTSACKTDTPTWVSASDWVDWDSSGTGCTGGDTLVVTWNIEFCSEAGGKTYDLDNSCVRAGGSVNCDGTLDYVDEWIVNNGAPPPSPTLSQVAYRWFQNTDSTAVGWPGTINTPVTAPTQGTPFRLRLLLYVTTTDLAINSTSTKLEYAIQSGECDTGFTGESWSPVDPSSGDIRFYDNSGAADNTALTPSTFDPTHSTTSIDADMVIVRTQDYEESDNATNTQAGIAKGEDGLWDFSLYDFSAPPDTTYCFRVVMAGSDHELADGYLVVPEITTAQVMRVRLRGNIRLRPVRLR